MKNAKNKTTPDLEKASEKELTGYDDATAYLKSSPKNAEQIDQSIKELEQGGGIELEIEEV